MKDNSKSINDETEVKAYVYGDTIELSANNIPYTQYILVISGHRYVNLKSGEICYMDTSGSRRTSNLSSIKRSMKNLRRIITANCSGGENELWVTLTYSHNVNALHAGDSKIVYNDFKIYMQKVRKLFGNVQYVCILEAQLSGRWHLHVLMKRIDGERFYVHNSLMYKLWSHGFTKTRRLSSSNNIAAYVMAYVSNLMVDSNSSKKRIIKNARLWMYPKGTRIYRRSKYIKDPTVEKTTKKEIKKRYNLTDKCKRGFYERKFSTKYEREIITQTEFFDRKSKNADDVNNKVKDDLAK